MSNNRSNDSDFLSSQDEPWITPDDAIRSLNLFQQPEQPKTFSSFGRYLLEDTIDSSASTIETEKLFDRKDVEPSFDMDSGMISEPDSLASDHSYGYEVSDDEIKMKKLHFSTIANLFENNNTNCLAEFHLKEAMQEEFSKALELLHPSSQREDTEEPTSSPSCVLFAPFEAEVQTQIIPMLSKPISKEKKKYKNYSPELQARVWEFYQLTAATNPETSLQITYNKFQEEVPAKTMSYWIKTK